MNARILALSLLGALAVSSFAQELYVPTRTVADQSISLRDWGSGTIRQTDEAAYEGTQSLRITSRNYFQGGVMMFGKPVDLTKPFADSGSLLSFAMKVPTLSAGGTGGGASSRPGMGNAGGGSSGAAGLGGEDGGRESGGGATTQATEEDTTLKQVRLIVSTTDGKKSEVYVPVRTSRPDDRGWSQISVPLQAIRGLEKTNKMVQSIAVATDVLATFYIGEVRVIVDSTPIYGEPNIRELNVGTDETITFSASGFGGASVLVYTWDFNSADGVGVDAEGQSVKRRFRKPGTYTVTLTIADKYGLKKAFTTTISIQVN